MANTTKVSLVRNVDVLVAFLFQIFMFHEVSDTNVEMYYVYCILYSVYPLT